MKIKTKNVIDCSEWDKMVVKTYGRPYCFQQQNGCRERGTVDLTVPSECEYGDAKDSIPEKVNHRDMCVSFAAWLARDPKRRLAEDEYGDQQWSIDMWWERNFYPDLQEVANDLHKRGMLEAGEYLIDIDW